MFSWLSFLTYVLITAATPGPNNIMSMTNAGRLGFRKSFPFNLGIWSGFTVVMILCTVFARMLTSFIPKIEKPMLVLGAAYMLYLAYKTFRSGSEISEKSQGEGFISGFMLQFVNPKIYIYGIVSMEAYIIPYYYNEPFALLGFAVLLAFIGFVFTLCWAAFGSVFRFLFSKHSGVTNSVMALLLLYCAASLFL